MCGIIGILGKTAVAENLLEGLKHLEYRGYDSAGIATITPRQIERRRAKGKLAALQQIITQYPIEGFSGIGHTRWATHGAANVANAHPHATKQAVIVHNGIIENYQDIKAELKDYNFTSETDSEAVVCLVTKLLDEGHSPQEAVRRTLRRIDGAFALAFMFRGHENLIIAARKGSPLALGYGEGEMFLGSDAMALAPFTQQITYLEEGDWAVITREGAQVYDENDQQVKRAITNSGISSAMIGKEGYRHFMAKEIHEQPLAVANTIHSYVNPQAQTITLPPLPFSFQDMSRLTISACGTAYYAGLIAKYWFEQIARLPVEADIASELRYRNAPIPKGSGALFISQSGETIDTLSSLRYVKSEGAKVLSIVNVSHSSIARESDGIIQTLAGPEIGVASTKAFTTQLSVLASLALTAAKERGVLKIKSEEEHVKALIALPHKLKDLLSLEGKIATLAESLQQARNVLYLGRGPLFPLALEGALKLKEISYIHAEGHAAGELKHGPIALIDEGTPTLVCAPSNLLFDKTASNIQEIIARGGKVILITDTQGQAALADKIPAKQCLVVPDCDTFTLPILYALPLQLIAYHTARLKGTDVDQPRNLAKSVTVE